MFNEFKVNLYKVFGNPNILTGDVIRQRLISENIAYELSWGKGLIGTGIWGVTFAHIHGKACPYESRVFNTKEDATAYIQQVQAHELFDTA